MSLEEFKRQAQNHFTVTLSWDEARALQRLYGNPDSGTIDFKKFVIALGKSPGHGPDKARRAYNFLPKANTDHDLGEIEKKIVQKLQGRCEGNYQYQRARRLLCGDPASTTSGGLNKDQLKLRLSGLLGVELSDREINAFFERHANPATGLVNIGSFVTHLLASDRENGWFTLENQIREPVVTNRISPSARYRYRPGVEAYNPMDTPFPKSLQGFKWDTQKTLSKLRMKMNEQAQGIAGYQFLAGCNFFRREMPNRKSDRMSVDDFRRIAEYKLGMKLDREETLALFDTLVPGTGETVGIADMARVLVPNDYTGSWFSTRDSTDMFGYARAAPNKVVLEIKERGLSGSWNLNLIEQKIREKIHERVGGKGVFEVQAAYTLFLDGRNTGLSKEVFKAKIHDKFAIVLSDKEVDQVFAKYDPRGTGSLDVHNFVLQLMSPERPPVPWFHNKATYEFRVLNRAPMKKDPMKAECWQRTRWTYQQFEDIMKNKLVAKSNHEFAYKSALKFLRSANPDHLDSANFDREALKFVVFRRFDIVMDEHLLDEVFSRLDPEGNGKVSVHRLVQRLLPSEQNVSHHLVPKTEEQRKATRILLDMTGKRREMINLNGSGIDDPQAQSLLSRIAGGDEDLIKASLIKDATASKTTMVNGPESTPLPGTGISPRRPQSSRGSTHTQSEGEESLTGRNRALGASRRKQANRSRLKTEKTPDQLQTPEHGWRQIVSTSPQGGAPVSRGRPPKIHGAPQYERRRTKGSEGKVNSDNDMTGALREEHAAEERIPIRPRSAASVRRGTFARARRRPRSASSSTTASQYEKKLGSAYARQMRAMDRLQKRRTDASSEGGRKGVGTGQFQSGLDRFVLLKGWDGNRDRSVSTGASRYGGGVPYFGP